MPVEVSDPRCTSAVFGARRAPYQEDKEMTKPETFGFIRLTASFAAGNEVIVNVKSKLGFPSYILNGDFREHTTQGKFSGKNISGAIVHNSVT